MHRCRFETCSVNWHYKYHSNRLKNYGRFLLFIINALPPMVDQAVDGSTFTGSKLMDKLKHFLSIAS